MLKQYDNRVGNWIATHSGKRVYLEDPQPQDYCIEDIAHALSNTCRFTGHTPHHYSVAQHSILVSRVVPDGFKLAALLHDASEAYLGDISRPLKNLLLMYKTIERAMQRQIYNKFGCSEILIDSSIIKEADNALLYCEAEIFGFPVEDFGIDKPDIKVCIYYAIHAQVNLCESEQMFMEHFNEYTQKSFRGTK